MDDNEKFDAAEALNVLAHDYGLYAVKTALDDLGFEAGMARDTLEGIDERGRELYEEWAQDAEQTNPYEVPAWARAILDEIGAS